MHLKNKVVIVGIMGAGSLLACQLNDASVGANTNPVDQNPVIETTSLPAPQKPGKPAVKAPQNVKVPKKEEGIFAPNAFPPVLSDQDYHRDGWWKNDCLRCHETGVQEAPEVEHKDLPAIYLTAKCRSCHVHIKGQPVSKRKKKKTIFAPNAFPPMMPASVSHKNAWTNDNCLLCHEDGVRKAPIVKHKDMSKLLLKVKCRSCHVQVSRPLPPRKKNK